MQLKNFIWKSPDGESYIIRVAEDGKHKYYAITFDKSNVEKKIYFGALPYEHFYDKLGFYKDLNHGDEDRRKAYRSRHGAIKNKDGTLAYKVKGSPAYFSWHILW